MPDTDRPQRCPGERHHWSPPEPRILDLDADGPVKHPTELMRWCLDRTATEPVEVPSR